MSDIMAGKAATAPQSVARVVPVTATDFGLIFLRLALGIVFVVHGWQLISNFQQTLIGMSTKGGIPVPLVYVTVFTEFFGGLAIIFGLLSRLASMGIIVVMLVAIFKVHLQNGFFMNWAGHQKGEGFEFHILVIAMALMLILAGPGRFALADIERRWIR
jgi:putative oxidoreductase